MLLFGCRTFLVSDLTPEAIFFGLDGSLTFVSRGNHIDLSRLSEDGTHLVSKIESGWIGKFLFEEILFWLFSLGTPNDGIIFLAFFPPPLIVVKGEAVPSSNAAGNAAMRVLAHFINCLISCCLFS